MGAKRGCLGLEREITNINKCYYKELAHISARTHSYPPPPPPHTHTHTKEKTKKPLFIYNNNKTKAVGLNNLFVRR